MSHWQLDDGAGLVPDSTGPLQRFTSEQGDDKGNFRSFCRIALRLHLWHGNSKQLQSSWAGHWSAHGTGLERWNGVRRWRMRTGEWGNGSIFLAWCFMSTRPSSWTNSSIRSMAGKMGGSVGEWSGLLSCIEGSREKSPHFYKLVIYVKKRKEKEIGQNRTVQLVQYNN